MPNQLLSPNEFAELSRTTKRTVLFYDQKNILKPDYINEKGYRFYKPEQILDFQVILLLRQLNFSIKEIQDYLIKNNTLKDLFKSKRSLIENEIIRLQNVLQNLDNYYSDLNINETLIHPQRRRICETW